MAQVNDNSIYYALKTSLITKARHYNSRTSKQLRKHTNKINVLKRKTTVDAKAATKHIQCHVQLNESDSNTKNNTLLSLA